MIEIALFNPYLDVTYRTKSFDIKRWENFLENFERGNEDVISFEPMSVSTYHSMECPNIVTICPKHWAQVAVRELEGGEDDRE